MKKNRRNFHLLSIMLTFVFLNPYVLGDQVRGEKNILDSLNLIKIDEKVKAQNFSLEDLNGNIVQLDDYLGKVVFLNFWTTWCPACLIEMPSMEKLYKSFKNKDFVILAVDMQEDKETVGEFKKRFKLSFPILLDKEGIVAAYYGVRGIPASYFIDREGYLYAVAMGARDWASEDAFQLVRHLLDPE